MDADAPPLVQTIDVRVDYGDVIAVRDLNLSIGPGEVFGLIGPNGAGKTSTIRVLATLLEPTYGDVFIGGFDVAQHPARARAILGYMPDLSPVPDDLRVWEMLDQFAAAHFLNRAQRRARVNEVLELVQLDAKRHVMAKTLSRGMAQRLVLAKTLLHEPRVMLLDEPASGLDPTARIELRHLLRRLAGEGRTVLISSHILTELSGFCTSIGIMEQGRLIEQGRLEDIATRIQPQRTLLIELLNGAAATTAEMLKNRAGVEEVQLSDGRLEVAFSGDERDIAALLRWLVVGGCPVLRFTEKQLDVEDVFLKVGAREVS